MPLPDRLIGRGEPSAVHAAIRSHRVQLFELDAEVVQSVRELVYAAIASGDAAVVIATEPHRQALRDVLELDGVDAAAAQADGQYIELDASATLAQIAHGDRLSDERFDDVVGGLIRDASARWGRVMAFGEMVSVLVSHGQPDAALELEGLWNGLRAERPVVDLLCAYPTRQVASAGDSCFAADMLATHTDRVPHGVSASGRSLEALEMTHILVESAPRQPQTLDFFVDVGERFGLSRAEVEASLRTLLATQSVRLTADGRWRAGRAA